MIPVFAGSNPAKETCERKTTMVIIKTIISTLDVIFMLILFVSGRESKDKETAIADLLLKGIYQEIEGELSYGNGIDAVVEVGLIIDQEATFDEQGNLLTEPTYRDGYHFDIMTEKEIDFGDNEIFPDNPKHTFAGI